MLKMFTYKNHQKTESLYSLRLRNTVTRNLKWAVIQLSKSIESVMVINYLVILPEGKYVMAPEIGSSLEGNGHSDPQYPQLSGISSG